MTPAGSSHAADIDNLADSVKSFWVDMNIKTSSSGLPQYASCYQVNRSSLSVIPINTNYNNWCRQVNTAHLWFRKGLSEELERINGWKNPAQKRVALRGTRLAFVKTQLIYYGSSAFNIAAEEPLFLHSDRTYELNFNDLVDKNGIAATSDQRLQVRRLLSDQSNINTMLTNLAYQEVSADVSRWSEPPPVKDPNDPLATRPRVFWLSYYMLQEVPSGASRASKARALAKQLQAVRYLDKAVMLGLIINYNAPGKPVVAALPQNNKVTSRLYEICRAGIVEDDYTTSPPQRRIINLADASASMRRAAATLNLFGRPAADGSNGTIGLGSSMLGMLRFPSQADISNSRRYFARGSFIFSPQVRAYSCTAR